MSVEDAKTVDAIHVDTPSGDVVLTIADHLEWDKKNEHLLILQDKINTYLRFIESGEIDSAYPEAIGRKRIVTLVVKYPPNDLAREFLERASSVLLGAGIDFRVTVHSSR